MTAEQCARIHVFAVPISDAGTNLATTLEAVRRSTAGAAASGAAGANFFSGLSDLAPAEGIEPRPSDYK